MNKPGKVLCSIATYGRYHTTLPLAIQSVIFQTRPVDKLVIFDDNENPIDVRDIQIYQYLFMMMQLKGIEWEWIFAEKKGQHFIHERANSMGYEWVWRVDDDAVPEPDTLAKLYEFAKPDVGAIGGAILTPPFSPLSNITGKIENITSEPNIQWDYIKEVKEVDHLHCSFLYRAGVHHYDLNLSKIAHREETLFTYGLKQKGYKVLVVPAVTWHLKNNEGGIRSAGKQEMFEHDEHHFRSILNAHILDKTIVVLDCGLGDHIVFKHVLPDIKNPVIFSCYPEVIPGRSIAEAQALLGDRINDYNIYVKMDQWNWKDSLENAYRKLYNAYPQGRV